MANNSSIDPWAKRARNLLKAELVRRGISYAALADRLHELGVPESGRNLATKINRGTFSAAFMIQCLTAAGAKRLEIVTDDPDADGS